MLIATSWNTVSFVKDQDSCDKKAYFVQDYEPWFYPTGKEQLEAEETYSLGLIPITIGKWLSNRIAIKEGTSCFYTNFGADHSIYFDKNENREKAICALYQPEKPRRGSHLVKETIDLITKFDDTVSIYVFGSNEKVHFKSPQVHNLGLLNPRELNDLYNKCRCGITVSSSNPSRVPFEMMTSGLIPIDLYKENNLYDFEDSTALLVSPNAGAYATAILELLSNHEESQRRLQKSKKFMQERDLFLESKQFVESIENILSKDATLLYERNPLSYIGNPVQENNKILAFRKEQRTAARRKAVEAQEPLHGKSFSMTLALLDPINANNEYKIAIWSQPNQSDIQWISNNKKEISENTLFFTFELTEEYAQRRSYQFHLYRYKPESEPEFLGHFLQMIISEKTVKEGTKTIENDLCTCSFSVIPSSSKAPSKHNKRSLFNALRKITVNAKITYSADL